MENVKSIN